MHPIFPYFPSKSNKYIKLRLGSKLIEITNTTIYTMQYAKISPRRKSFLNNVPKLLVVLHPTYQG